MKKVMMISMLALTMTASAKDGLLTHFTRLQLTTRFYNVWHRR